MAVLCCVVAVVCSLVLRCTSLSLNRNKAARRTQQGSDAGAEGAAVWISHHLLVCNVALGDGHTFTALVDTGSGNLAVPAANCESPGCQHHQRFHPDWDSSGSFLGSDTTDLSLSFATGHLEGSGFNGRICLGHVCGNVGFVVAAFESQEFQDLPFDAVLGLGPPRQALAPGFNILSALVQQGVVPHQAFVLSLRSRGNSSMLLGGYGNFSEWTSGANATSAKPAGELLQVSPPVHALWLAADARHGEWAVPLLDVLVEGRGVGACGGKGCRAVLDTGCTGLALPKLAMEKLKRLLRLDGCSAGAINALPRLGFLLGNGLTYEIHPERLVEFSNAELEEDAKAVSDNAAADDGAHCRLMVNEIDAFSRTVMLGLPFLLDRDILFDQGRMRVGLTGAVPVRPPA
mmetsp:Transcript_129510/g.242267  ORF Transcript_129510/g.242267 Transcript_129510/m.242267 type:complete len:403 (-) Transcript_129510:54-1262(-)